MNILSFANRHYLWFLFSCCLSASLDAQSRSWKNTEGKDIQAEYISHDETAVTLKFKGKEISYSLEKLSEKDIQWLQEQGVPADKKNNEIQTGLLKGEPISEKLFETENDFFSEKVRRNSLKEFEAGAFNGLKLGPREGWFVRDLVNDKCQIYVPPSYDGTEPYGVLLFIQPVETGNISTTVRSLADEFKLIAVSADGVGNSSHFLRRVMLSMDALATVEKRYQINPEHRIVTGISGGGHIAMLTAALFPEHFLGAISHAAQSYLPSSGKVHFPGMTLRDFQRGERKKLMWVVVSGDKDFNYEEIKKSSAVWEQERLNYRFIDVPGLGHAEAPREAFQEAYKWVVAGRAK